MFFFSSSSSSWQVSMYTVVSLTVDLAGEPDTIDFTSLLFGLIFYCFGLSRAGVPFHITSSHLTCTHFTHLNQRWWEEKRDLNELCVDSVCVCVCVMKHFFSLSSFSFVSQSSSSGNPSLHCSMSSSADFSDEDDFSVKSGSASPAPGDTLPWNLPRHERSKRKIQGGSVLDPAERAVLRIAGERQSPCCQVIRQ